MHRDLYLEALRRIGELELDGRSLQNLAVCMEDMKVTMVRTWITIVLINLFQWGKLVLNHTECVSWPQQTSLTCDTDAALTSMKQIEEVAREDRENLLKHVCEPVVAARLCEMIV